MAENPSILSHISLGTNDFERAVAFYDKVLPALGCRRLMEHPGAVAWPPVPGVLGAETHRRQARQHRQRHPRRFFAADQAAVQAFYQAALDAGGTSDGEPGPRAEYGAPYFGCFVRDPDGHKIEAAFWDLALDCELVVEPHTH